MQNNNFYFADSLDTSYFFCGFFSQSYTAYGAPQTSMQEYYSINPQFPMFYQNPCGNALPTQCSGPLIDYPAVAPESHGVCPIQTPEYEAVFPFQTTQSQSAFPIQTSEFQPVLPVQDSEPFGSTDNYVDVVQFIDPCTISDESSQIQNALPNTDLWDDLDSVVSNTTVPYVEEEQTFYPGIFAPSLRSRKHPVLLYRIPKTDLCYVYNRFCKTYQDSVTYVCRECRILKKHVTSEVTGLCYFTEDPIRAGHICQPKRFTKEASSRQAVTIRYRSTDHDSGFGESLVDELDATTYPALRSALN